MRNLTIRLAAALITFGLGLSAVALRPGLTRRPDGAWTQDARGSVAGAPAPCAAPEAARPAEREGLPILSYCELANNVARYSGEVVRVRATMRMSIHGLFLSDAACALYESQAAVDFHPASKETLVGMLYGADGSAYFRADPAELILVGRFERVTPSHVSDSLLDTLPLRFEILHVEKVARAAR